MVIVESIENDDEVWNLSIKNTSVGILGLLVRGWTFFQIGKQRLKSKCMHKPNKWKFKTCIPQISQFTRQTYYYQQMVSTYCLKIRF